MTIGLRMASEKRNRRLPATCYRYVTAILFFWGITEASPAPSEENSIIEAYVELGRYGPYGYGPTTSITLNVKSLFGLKPFAGFSGIDVDPTFNPFSNLSYQVGIGYEAEFSMEYAPSLTISSLFRTRGKQAKIFLAGGWLDLVKSDNFDVMIGVAFEIASGWTKANKEFLERHNRTHDGNIRSFISPTWSVGFRVP